MIYQLGSTLTDAIVLAIIQGGRLWLFYLAAGEEGGGY